MYRFRITTGIERCLHRIESARERLDRVGPLPRVWHGRTRQEIEAEAVAASTRMEGVAVTVDEARRILVGDRPSGVSEQDADLVAGYQEAMRYVLARADDPAFEWHRELMLAVHHRVLAGSFAAEAGRFRQAQNWVVSSDTGLQRYLPPAPDDVPALVDELAAWLQETEFPAPVASALAHVRLAGIHPFRDGNGRTARVLASLVMYRAGYKRPYFTSLEEWWGRHLDEYYAAFDSLGSEWDPDADVTGFVRVHVCAQAAQVDALSLRNRIEHAVWTVLEDVAVHDLGLRERVTHALYDAFFAREVTNRYYRGMADVSDVTASHDLGRLTTAGLLAQEGAGRSSHYVGTEQLARAVARGALGSDERVVPEGASREERRDAVLAAIGDRLRDDGG